jgi:hypothetical protein
MLLQDFISETQSVSPAPVHTVLFSADGVTWTELHRSLDHITSLAVGDDEVIIARLNMNGPTSTLLPVEAD